jgi:hypothetical protein
MGVDGDVEPDGVTAPAPTEAKETQNDEDAPAGFDRWRKGSPIGGIGTGIARGLQAVFAPRRDEVAIVAAVPGEPPDADQRVRVILDFDDPTKSVAIMPGASAEPDEPTDGTPDS